jgi:hypothetical protein
MGGQQISDVRVCMMHDLARCENLGACESLQFAKFLGRALFSGQNQIY